MKKKLKIAGFTKETVLVWALYFLSKSNDPRFHQRGQVIYFSKNVIPVLRLEKALGFSTMVRIPKTFLTKRENEVMSLYFFTPLSERAVGRFLGISNSTVRSYKNNALAKIDSLLSSFASYQISRKLL